MSREAFISNGGIVKDMRNETAIICLITNNWDGPIHISIELNPSSNVFIFSTEWAKDFNHFVGFYRVILVQFHFAVSFQRMFSFLSSSEVHGSIPVTVRFRFSARNDVTYLKANGHTHIYIYLYNLRIEGSERILKVLRTDVNMAIK